MISDSDISTETYGKVVLFELSLRMHANNSKLLNEREDLISVIEKLCDFKNLEVTERVQLHLGRKFLNMTKHNKNQFSTWTEGISAFERAFDILIKHRITIL